MSFKIITEVLPQKMNGTFKEQLTVYQRTVNLFEEAFENAKKAMQSYEEKLKNIKIPEKYNNKMEDVTDNGSLNTSTDGQVDDKKEVKPATESKTEENADTEADKSDISAINAASLQDAIKKLKKVDDKEEVNKNPLKKKITGPFEAKILQEVAEKMEATQQSDDEGNSTSDSEEESSEW